MLFRSNILGGVFIKIKLGNYLNNQNAIISSLSYEIPDESSWDIDKELAMYIKASFSLSILGNDKQQPKYNNTGAFITATA